MTSRADIVDGAEANGRKYGLIYTRKCGWVDLGHANPAGALGLWNQILNEATNETESEGYFKISYEQKNGAALFQISVFYFLCLLRFVVLFRCHYFFSPRLNKYKQAKRPTEVKGNIAENEFAKLTTNKGTAEAFNGIAAVDRKLQIFIDA